MKYILGCYCLFMGHEIYQSEIFGNFITHKTPFSVLSELFMVPEICQSEIFGNFMTHETPFSVLCKLFMVHENQPLKFSCTISKTSARVSSGFQT